MEIVRVANQHLVAPALLHALRQKGLVDDLPPDVAAYFAELHSGNADRNRQLHRQALEVAKALNGRGISPLFLKGGLTLFEPAFGDIGNQMMRDLDILVRRPNFDEAIIVMRSLGYEPVGDQHGWHYAYPPLCRSGDTASIDLHRDVGNQRLFLNAEAAFRDAVPVETEGVRALGLSPTHRIFHNVFHAQIQNRQHELGIASIKELHAMAAICSQYADAIDWDAVYHLFGRHRLARVLDGQLELANRLLSLPLPDCRQRTAPIHYAKCMMRARWPTLARAANAWAAATHPFKRTNIEYMFGGGSRLRLNINRARYGLRVLRRYRWSIFTGVRSKRMVFYEQE